MLEEMLKIKRVLILLMIFISCLSFGENTKSDYPDINPEFNMYISSFIEKSNGLINETDFDDVYMGFKKYEDGDVVGYCSITPFYRQIDINLDWWKSHQYQLSREELIFHELGHCVLYRPHTEPTSTGGVLGFFERLLFDLGISQRMGYLNDGCPASYMHPTIVDTYCINKHHKYYISEIFDYDEEKETFHLYEE